MGPGRFSPYAGYLAGELVDRGTQLVGAQKADGTGAQVEEVFPEIQREAEDLAAVTDGVGEVDQSIGLATKAGDPPLVGVDQVILEATEAGVGLVLVAHLDEGVLRGEHFEDDLGADPAFDPLPIRAPIPRRTADGHHAIGGETRLRVALLEVPQQIAGDEDIEPVAVPAAHGRDEIGNGVPLQRVVGHGLTIAVRVLHGGEERVGHTRERTECSLRHGRKRYVVGCDNSG